MKVHLLDTTNETARERGWARCGMFNTHLSTVTENEDDVTCGHCRRYIERGGDALTVRYSVTVGEQPPHAFDVELATLPIAEYDVGPGGPRRRSVDWAHVDRVVARFRAALTREVHKLEEQSSGGAVAGRDDA